MGKKIVFFDLDGTLLDEHKRITPEVKQAVRQLRNNGVLTAFATGRAPFMFRQFQRELAIDITVSFNGQYVVCGNQIVFQHPLEYEKLQQLQKEAESNNHPMVFLGVNEMKANRKDHPYIERSLADLKAEHPPMDPDFHRNHDIYQALLFCRHPGEELYNIENTGFRFIRWHELSLDVLPAGGSKAAGIARLLDYLDIRREDSYAFGDGYNDIEMLEYVGTGVAMGNAREETKHAADFVTHDLNDNGLIHGLRQVHLLE